MAEARLEFVQGGLEAECVFEFRDTQGGQTAQNLADDVQNFFWAALAARTSQDCQLVHIRTKVGTDEADNAVALNGNDFGTATPPHTCALVTKLISGARNGRFFWPGVPENEVNAGGRWTSTAATDWATSLGDAQTNMATAGWVMQVTDKLLVARDVADLALVPYVGTQRRRLQN